MKLILRETNGTGAQDLKAEDTATRVSTTDPSSMRDVPGPQTHPLPIKAMGEGAIKINFESEEMKHTWENIAAARQGPHRKYR
jgi:hypothetical protein